MSVKVGDTVRFLNAVGGGRVVRIADGIAYVDEDGFETPVLLRECVVVAAPSAAKPSATPSVKDTTPENLRYDKPAGKAPEAPRPTALPVVETAGGDVLNLVLGFEPTDIKALSHSSFEAYIVNDSNYYVYVAVATRDSLESEWTLRYDGLIEPNIQEFAFELSTSDLPHIDRIDVKYIAFKRDKAFEAKAPGAVEIKVDNTKFARLHCFRPNPYFDRPVIAFDIASHDRPAVQPDFNPQQIAGGMREKKRDVAAQSRFEQSRRKSEPSRGSADGVIVVDLHASELLDTTAGLSPADILNLQIDRFSEVMDANMRRPGQKIVFIHGKGEGVLRQALMKELTHRYKGHDVQDASFREYGFGATQVTIRQVQPGGFKPKGKR